MTEAPILLCVALTLVSFIGSSHGNSSDNYASGKVTVGCRQCGKGFAKAEELAQHILVCPLMRPPTAPPLHFYHLSKIKKKGNSLPRITERSAGLSLELFGTVDDMPVHFAEVPSIEGSGSPALDAAVQCTTRAEPTPGDEGKHYCPYCQKEFRYSFNLRRHINTHMTFFQHRCHICGRGFHRSDFMQRHIRTVHRNILSPVQKM